METFLKALPTVASSPLAYAAYVFTLIAWLLIAWRVRRYQVLLKHLKTVPSKDRLAAIKAEMGAIDIRGGITADQWLKARIQTFLFFGFSIVCATILAVVAMTLFLGKGAISGSLSLGN